jgi:hypothetical protein
MFLVMTTVFHFIHQHEFLAAIIFEKHVYHEEVWGKRSSYPAGPVGGANLKPHTGSRRNLACL